jgi:hypothetical protein
MKVKGVLKDDRKRISQITSKRERQVIDIGNRAVSKREKNGNDVMYKKFSYIPQLCHVK